MLDLYLDQLSDEMHDKAEGIFNILLRLLDQDTNIASTYGFADFEEFSYAVELGCVCMDMSETVGPFMFLCADYKGADLIKRIHELHPIWSNTLVKRLSDFPDEGYAKLIEDLCLYHHEKHNGEGYPHGLKGDAIPKIAQLCSMACDIEKMFNNKNIQAEKRLSFTLENMQELPWYSREVKACLAKATSELTEYYMRKCCAVGV